MSTYELGPIEVRVVPALRDNYMYIVTDTQSGESALVDPVEPATILRAASCLPRPPGLCLVTHHHYDHAGGNLQLLKERPELPVLSGDERVPGTTRLLQHKEHLTLGTLTVTALATPAHTTGSVCYVVNAGDGNSAVFTGDTLFSAGCGRLFEGSPEQLLAAMDLLAELPGDTRVFPGHEYTMDNLRFAAHVQPNNPYVKTRALWAKKKREDGEPTIPSTIGDEIQFNPFMRARSQDLAKGESDPIAVIKRLRLEKDNFK